MKFKLFINKESKPFSFAFFLYINKTIKLYSTWQGARLNKNNLQYKQHNKKSNATYRDLFSSPLFQISQLQYELKKARKERDFERQRSLKNPTDTQKLKDELNAVRAKLLETETLFPVNKRLIFIAI